jgi:hypothetical protein
VINSVDVYKEGNLIVCGTSEGEVVFKQKNNEEIIKAKNHVGIVTCVCVSPDTKLIASGGDD